MYRRNNLPIFFMVTCDLVDLVYKTFCNKIIPYRLLREKWVPVSYSIILVCILGRQRLFLCRKVDSITRGILKPVLIPLNLFCKCVCVCVFFFFFFFSYPVEFSGQKTKLLYFRNETILAVMQKIDVADCFYQTFPQISYEVNNVRAFSLSRWQVNQVVLE